MQSFFAKIPSNIYYYCDFFFNVQYSIDPAVISLLNVNRNYLLRVLRPEVRYETRAAIC